MRARADEQALDNQKRATAEAVDVFLQESEEAAAGGIFGRFGSSLGLTQPPEPRAHPAHPGPARVRAPGTADRPQQAPQAGAPKGAACGSRKEMGEQCLDAFGGGASESRYWEASGPVAPPNPKRPPGAGNGNGSAQGHQQPMLWPYGSQQSMTSLGPNPQPLQKLKARAALRPLRAVCGGPLGLYLLSALSFALLWQVWPLPTLLTLFGLVLALHISLPQPVNAKGRFGNGDLVPCGVCLIAAALGVFTGIYAHEAYAGPYYRVALGREYRNVLASSPGAAYSDAGRLHFANTSALDLTRVLGYQNQRRYCVAPVVDSGAAQTTRMGFWAVGIDCCDYRGNFRCGDAGAGSSVKSGARAPQDGIFESPRTNFIHAIEQAAAVYNLQVDADAILVNWVADPASARGASLAAAFGVVFFGAFLFVLLAVATLTVTSA